MAKRSMEKRTALSDHTYHIGVILGIVIGAAVLISGFILSILGLTGSVEWVMEGSGLKTRLTNGTPGAVFALAGLIIVIWFKPRIKHSQTIKTERTDETHKGENGTYRRTTTTSTENKHSGARFAK